MQTIFLILQMSIQLEISKRSIFDLQAKYGQNSVVYLTYESNKEQKQTASIRLVEVLYNNAVDPVHILFDAKGNMQDPTFHIAPGRSNLGFSGSCRDLLKIDEQTLKFNCDINNMPI
eukprot:NODE_40_length_35084_cov_0.543519.p26 type:complete len:117 gc:universal NODE_40_length_35084_cov_0.543519:34958-34608(-)